MQFNALLVLAASLALATAHDTKYIVGNCGDAAGADTDKSDKACGEVSGKFCEMGGVGRCIVEEELWSKFQDNCEGGSFQRPGTYSKSTAEQVALCKESLGGIGVGKGDVGGLGL